MPPQAEPIRAIVADDEPLARRLLVRLLAREPDITIVAQAANGPDTVEVVREHSPDVLFLDVHMPGATGIEVLEALGTGTVRAVVLVTAHDDYAIAAFEHHALDYVLKPIDESRFRSAVQRVRNRLHESRAALLTETSMRALAQFYAAAAPDGAQPWLSRLIARTAGKVTVVEVADIDWVGAADDYLEVHAGTTVHYVRGSMASLESRLDPAEFIRIHRSSLIRLSRVKELEPYFHGDYSVTLHDGTRLRLSRTYRARFEQALGHAI
ncbi:MAG TPA: LytTR family DNA-binding domain-containing protein [Longimicrobiales bacterium]